MKDGYTGIVEGPADDSAVAAAGERGFEFSVIVTGFDECEWTNLAAVEESDAKWTVPIPCNPSRASLLAYGRTHAKTSLEELITQTPAPEPTVTCVQKLPTGTK